MKSQPAQFNSIINHLHSNQTIPMQEIDEDLAFDSPQYSCYVGFATLIYNRALDAKGKIQQNMRNGAQAMTQDMGNINQAYSEGQILKIKGDVLKQFGKFLQPVLPAPACYLAYFNFKQMEQFCSNQPDPVMRHLRGIYPVIDTDELTPLQFLPYFQYLEGIDAKLVVGNHNWLIAREVLNQFYEKIIKVRVPSFECDDDYALGLRLTYMMILGRQNQMIQYLDYLKAKESGVSSQVIYRFQYWIKNYFQFVSGGLNLYQKGQNPEVKEQIKIPLLEKSAKNRFQHNKKAAQQELEQLEYHMLECLNKLINLPHQNAGPSILQENINEMLKIIQKGLNQPRQEVKKLQLLLHSIIHCLIKILLPDQIKISKQMYERIIDFRYAQLQPFLRVFYTDDEILHLFKTNKCTRVPTKYAFSPVLMKKIVLICIENNEQQHITDQKTMSYLNKIQQLSILTNSCLIGTSQDTHIPSGVDVLEILIANKQDYGKALSQQLRMNLTQQFQEYLSNWELYYRSIKDSFSIKNTYMLLNSFEAAQLTKVVFKSINLKHPLQRIDTSSKLVSGFLNLLKDTNKRYEKLQANFKNQFERKSKKLEKSQIKTTLDQLFKILFNQTFLNILQTLEKDDAKQEKLLVDSIWAEWAKSVFITSNADIQIQIQREQSQDGDFSDEGNEYGMGEQEIQID